jgi:hypothetical protein
MKFSIDHVAGVKINWPSIKQESTRQVASNTSYPSFRNVDSFTVTFHEDNKGTILDYFNEWTDKIYKDGVYGIPSGPDGYKSDSVMIAIMNQYGLPVVVFNAGGVWPMSITGYEFDTSSGNKHIQPVITFSCDNIQVMTVGSLLGNVGKMAGSALGMAIK